MIEAYCKSIGQDFIWMQFSNIYGPLNKTGNLVSYTINKLANGEDATFGPANQMYDFIYIDDLIEAVIKLGEKKTDKDFYFVGSGEPRLLKEYLIEIGRLSGHEELIKIGVRPDDGIKYSIDMFDVSDLKKAIGDYVDTSFKEGIMRTLKAYKVET